MLMGVPASGALVGALCWLPAESCAAWDGGSRCAARRFGDTLIAVFASRAGSGSPCGCWCRSASHDGARWGRRTR